MSTVHDVLRYLVRNQGHANGAVEQDLLLTIDANEQGFPDLESYKEKLADDARRQAVENQVANVNLGQAQVKAAAINAAEDAELEAELARRQAARRAVSGTQTLRTAPPAFGPGSGAPPG